LPARIAKARFFKLYQTEFLDRLTFEIGCAKRLADRKGTELFVRLNVFSDVMWERVAPSIFRDFPDVVFYDYTKHYNRMLRFINGDFPPNYHLTFSWSGVNQEQSLDVLRNGSNVAIPFHVKYRGENRRPLPSKFLEYEIIDGDVTDLRPLDPTGKVVGLRVKGKGKADDTDFVIHPNDGRVN
jgi:hypothetical protein